MDKYTLSFELTGDGPKKLLEQVAAAEKKVADSFQELSQKSKISADAIKQNAKEVALAWSQALKEDMSRSSTQLKGDVGSAKYISQLKQMRSELSPTSAEFTKLNATIAMHERALDKAAGKSAFFRDRGLNLAKDASLIAMNVRGLGQDLNDLGDALQGGSDSFGKISAAASSASLSVLALVPAFNSLKRAIPTNEFTKGAGVVSLFSVAMFDAVNKADTLYKAFINLTQGGQGFWESLGNALSSNIIGQLTQELFGLNQEIEKSIKWMYASEKERGNMQQRKKMKDLGISDENITEALRLDAEQEADQQDKQRREEQRSQYIAGLDADTKKTVKMRSVSTQSIKEEKSAILLMVEAMKIEIDTKFRLKKLETDWLIEKIHTLTALDLETLKYEELVAVTDELADARKKLFDIGPAFNFGEGLKLPEGGEVQDRIKGKEKKEDEKLTLDELVNRGLNFGNQLVSILKIGADSFIGTLISGIQSAISLANSLMSFLGGAFGLAGDVMSGGIFGLIGSIFSAPQNPTSTGMARSNMMQPIIQIAGGGISRLDQLDITMNGQALIDRRGARNI